MAHKQHRQGGNAIPTDWTSIDVIGCLPPADHYLDRAEHVFEALRGSRILAIGAPLGDEIKVEGGGLIIDFQSSSGLPMRVVFGFNGQGMWIEYFGPSRDGAR